jgi:hypothetical protein
MLKQNNTLLTKAILRDEKADDFVSFNHKILTSVCNSCILVLTKYELQIARPSGGIKISCNDEE